MRHIPVAALPIAALVCGYPGIHRSRRQLLVWQAYVDDSMTDGKVLVLGGLVSSVAAWEAFSVEWDDRCRHAGWPIFKMAQVWSRRHNPDVWEHAKWHYFTIRDHVGGAICATVLLTGFQDSVRKYRLTKTAAANPYTWAFKGIISGLSSNQREWGLDEPVDFIFDERGEEKDVREGWDTFAATIPAEQRAILGRKPNFEDDKEFRPLQAADMWAWWCRKAWQDNGGLIPPDCFPVPWGKAGEIPQMILQWSSAELDRELARVAASLDAAERARDG